MFLISRTGWTKNGIYKGQTLVQWGGCCTATLDPLLQVLYCDFRIFFDNNVCNRKRCTYLKGFFKTLKSRNITLLVNSRSNTPSPIYLWTINIPFPCFVIGRIKIRMITSLLARLSTRGTHMQYSPIFQRQDLSLRPCLLAEDHVCLHKQINQH